VSHPEEKVNYPEDLKYTKDHEWTKVEGDLVVIGVTDFAQRELGDIVFVEVETIEEELEKGDTFGIIEAVKTVSDLFMPISGTVMELNPALEDTPEKINEDPYGEGWLIKIKPSNIADLEELMDVEAYKQEI